MLDLETPKHPVGWAGQLAGLNPGTARSWVQNDWIKIKRGFDQRASRPGATTLLSGRRVFQMVIAAKAVLDVRVHPEAACAAAYQFTDRYNSNEAPGFSRDPCELYSDQPGDSSLTLLAVYSEPKLSKVLRMDSASLGDVIFPRAITRAPAPTVLLLDHLVREVVRPALEKFDEVA